jgi:adenylate cyclase
LPDKPSIAVLPFANISRDPEQEYFADGLTEDIITALSRVGALFVIARNSTFAYKNKPVDVRQIASELGVQYVMEGSVRRSEDRIRITAQVLEAATGRHIWADKYDRQIEDIFEVQDDITAHVTASAETHIALHEKARPAKTARPELNVWLLVRRSWQRLHALTFESLLDARRLAEMALNLAPQTGLAYEVLSIILSHQAFMGMAADRTRTLAEARNAAERALNLPGHSEYAYWALGLVQFFSGERERAVRTTRQVLDINPNCALAHGTIGSYLAILGRADESIAATQFALRINPRDPSNFFRHQGLSDAYFVKRDFEAMVTWAEKAVASKTDYIPSHLSVIAGLALLNRPTEAAAAVRQFALDVPAERRSRLQASASRFARKEDGSLFRDGLRRGGLAIAGTI